MGLSTVAFNEQQVYSILKAISDETIISSFHTMKNILEEAMRVGVQTWSGNSGPVRSRVRCFSGQSGGSTAGSRVIDSTGGYTSGALSSDDDFATFDTPTTGVHEGPAILLGWSFSSQVAAKAVSPSENIVPSLEFSSADYEPLCNLRQSASSGLVVPSPPAEEMSSSCRRPNSRGKIVQKPS